MQTWILVVVIGSRLTFGPTYYSAAECDAAGTHLSRLRAAHVFCIPGPVIER